MMISSTSSDRPRLLFINRSYWPDVEATGQLLTELCEDLARSFEVTVIAGQPIRNPSGCRFRRHGGQWKRGVWIQRVWNFEFPKTSFLGRAINQISFLLLATQAAFSRRRPAIVIVQTDPPLLSLLGLLLRQWMRCPLVIYLQDVYPDVAIAIGKLGRQWLLTRTLRSLLHRAYRRADRLVVLSEDMHSFLVSIRVDPERIVHIPNWVDTQQVFPVKRKNPFRDRHNLDGHFVVMYSGNLGWSQRLETVIGAAERLRDEDRIVFLLVGDGASRDHLQALARNKALSNVRFLPYQPKEELARSLSSADLHLVPLDARLRHYLMPSKLYGILASGTAVLAAAPEESELARITQQAGLGLVVPPDDAKAMARAIRWGHEHPSELRSMGEKARQVAVDRFDRSISTGRLAQMFSDLADHES